MTTNPLALARPSYLQGPSRKEVEVPAPLSTWEMACEEQAAKRGGNPNLGEELEALSAAITAAYTAQRNWLEANEYTLFVKGYYEDQRSYYVHPLYLSLWLNRGEALLYDQETPSWAVVVL